MPGEEERAQIRARIDEIARRLRHDRTFSEQLISDPVMTLKASQLPDAAIAEILASQIEFQPDVAGYDNASAHCQDDSSCYLSAGACGITALTTGYHPKDRVVIPCCI